MTPDITMRPIQIFYSLLLLLLCGALCGGAQEVKVSAGLHVVASGSPQLVFHNLGLNNNGCFKAAGSAVVFTDSTSSLPVVIGGSSKTSFHQLAIHQDVQLANNIQVTGNIFLNKGNLQLDRYTLDLGSSGNIIGESNKSRIMGKPGGTVIRTAFLQAPDRINPGNIGVSITSAANLGTTVITRGHESPLQTTGTATTARYFDIAPAFNQNLDASLQFHYLDAELSGNEAELTLFSSDGYGWKVSGKDNSNASCNWLTKSRLGQLHRFTLAGSKQPGLKASNTIQAYPNPVHDKLTVVLPVSSKQEVVLLLVDQLGQVIERRKVVCSTGSNVIEWNVQRYAAGNYHLAFEGIDAGAVKIIKEITGATIGRSNEDIKA